MTTQIKLLKLKIEQQEIFLKQRKDMFSVSLDTILLTNFVEVKNQAKTLVDFGTNNGAIAILLAKKYNINIIGIEIQKEAVELAIENVRLNNLANQITIFHQDIKTYAHDTSLKNEKVDIIVCNPPFFPFSAKANLKVEPLKIAARHEIYLDCEALISSASKILKIKGKLFIIYAANRIDQLLVLLKNYQFVVKRIQVVYPKINKNANLVLVEAVFKTNFNMVIEPPLICHNDDGSYNSEIAKWYNK